MTKLHDNNAINLIFQLLTGDRPGSNGKNSLLALKYEDISIFEKEGLFALHFSGQSKKKKTIEKNYDSNLPKKSLNGNKIMMARNVYLTLALTRNWKNTLKFVLLSN
jgi:hypothetical protein